MRTLPIPADALSNGGARKKRKGWRIVVPFPLSWTQRTFCHTRTAISRVSLVHLVAIFGPSKVPQSVCGWFRSLPGHGRSPLLVKAIPLDQPTIGLRPVRFAFARRYSVLEFLQPGK